MNLKTTVQEVKIKRNTIGNKEKQQPKEKIKGTWQLKMNSKVMKRKVDPASHTFKGVGKTPKTKVEEAKTKSKWEREEK